MNLELTSDHITTLARACECAAKAMEIALMDENYMLDFIEKDQKKMADFRTKCVDLQMRLHAILAQSGQDRPVECWELRVITDL
jgi:hypothetical protein